MDFLGAAQLGTVIPYLKKIQKIYESHDTALEFCWHQYFFTRNQEILLYQKIQIQIRFWYIISNSFNFSSVFSVQIFFNIHGNIFDDVIKNSYPRPSENKGFLKYRLWHHNLSSYPAATTQKIKILKKWKKCPEILPLQTHVQKMTVIWCMVPEISSATDKLFCHFGLFFALLPP